MGLSLSTGFRFLLAIDLGLQVLLLRIQLGDERLKSLNHDSLGCYVDLLATDNH